jgi:hypothetical protein
MSPRSFLVLLLVTLGSVALATVAAFDRDLPVQTTQLDLPLAPGLEADLDGVARIVAITESGTSTIVRGEAAWTIEEKGGYPVDPNKVRDLVLAAASARLVEAKTDDPDRLPRLELADPGQPDARSRGVRIEAEDGTPLAAIVVGKTKHGLYGSGRGGVYVRRVDETQAWLADRTIPVPGAAIDWLERQVLDLPSGEIALIRLESEGGEPVELVRAAADAEALSLAVPAPEGQEADQARIEQLSAALASLSMQDVRPRTGDSPDPVARFITRDGLQVDVALRKEAEGEEAAYWAEFEVALTEPPLPSPPADVADGGAQQPAEGGETETASPGADARAAELSRRLAGWSFRIPAYLAERFEWGRGDLLKPAGNGTS